MLDTISEIIAEKTLYVKEKQDDDVRRTCER